VSSGWVANLGIFLGCGFICTACKRLLRHDICCTSDHTICLGAFRARVGSSGRVFGPFWWVYCYYGHVLIVGCATDMDWKEDAGCDGAVCCW